MRLPDLRKSTPRNMETPTSPVTAVDRDGKTHQFAMGFGARRRIMRRLRTLQLKGELHSDLDKIEALDNLEFAYITAWECRQTPTRLAEDDYLGQFDDTALATAANEIWGRYKAESAPTNPGPEAASQPSERMTTTAADSGVDG